MTRSRLLTTLLFAALAACSRGDDEGFRLIHVDDVMALRARDAVTVLDANAADFRAREGIIPGAILLTSYKSYDADAELPHDKSAPLVFYCADAH